MPVSKNDSIVRGVYKTRLEAERALSILKNKKNNFTDSDILVHIPFRCNAVNNHMPQNQQSTNRSRALIGMVLGMLAGAVSVGGLALLSAFGLITSPGIVTFVPAGPILTCMAGVGFGGIIGGMTGALIGLGIPEHETERNNNNNLIKSNGIILTVKTKSKEDVSKVITCLKNTGGENIYASNESDRTLLMGSIQQNGSELVT